MTDYNKALQDLLKYQPSQNLKYRKNPFLKFIYSNTVSELMLRINVAFKLAMRSENG